MARPVRRAAIPLSGLEQMASPRECAARQVPRIRSMQRAGPWLLSPTGRLEIVRMALPLRAVGVPADRTAEDTLVGEEASPVGAAVVIAVDRAAVVVEAEVAGTTSHQSHRPGCVKAARPLTV